MNGRVALVVELVAFLVFPFVLWVALFVTVRQWSTNLSRTLPWIRGLRYLTSGAGLLMILTYSGHDSIPAFYGIGIFAASFGLIFPEEWVKRRFAPDLLHDAESPEGWWPSKPE